MTVFALPPLLPRLYARGTGPLGWTKNSQTPRSAPSSRLDPSDTTEPELPSRDQTPLSLFRPRRAHSKANYRRSAIPQNSLPAAIRSGGGSFRQAPRESGYSERDFP